MPDKINTLAEKETRVISISIFKGGTGKTTTSISLCASLANLGKSVLLIDLDQQASATRHLGIDPDKIQPHLYHVFTKQVPANLAVHPTNFGFEVMPANSLLAAIEEAMEPDKDEGMLREAIAGIKSNWDYVIIDSPPGKAMLALNALAAAGEVIIPLQSERPALDGAADILRYIQDIVWDKYNPDLKILGILPTMMRRTTSHSTGVIKKAREIWGDKVFAQEIPASIQFPRAFEVGTPLLNLDPDHAGARLYLDLAKHIDERR